MFFPELITKIKPTDKVLEIGPGALPYSRSDVYLEKHFEKEEADKQRGNIEKIAYSKPVIYYDELPFPIEDKEYDYVICSHVIEHIPKKDLNFFISELQRISSKGYIEFPTVYYELINFQSVHLWLMNFRNNKMLFLDKKNFNSDFIHQIYRKLFFSDPRFNTLFIDYKKLFFYGFEWSGKVNYEIVKSFNDLISEDDFQRQKDYIENINLINSFEMPNSLMKISRMKTFRQKIKKILPLRILSIVRKFKALSKNNNRFYIHKTAKLTNLALIELGENSEIKEYVIIQPCNKKISIGKNTQINPFTVIYGGNEIRIGDNVMIAPHCMIAAGNHDYKQLLVPMRLAGNLTKGPIIIKNDVWIGANVTILDGVTINEGAVIAANSLVNTDVKEYDIVGGVPIRILGNRTDPTLQLSDREIRFF